MLAQLSVGQRDVEGVGGVHGHGMVDGECLLVGVVHGVAQGVACDVVAAHIANGAREGHLRGFVGSGLVAHAAHLELVLGHVVALYEGLDADGAAGAGPAVLAVIIDDVAIAVFLIAVAYAAGRGEGALVADGQRLAVEGEGGLELYVVPTGLQIVELLPVEVLRVVCVGLEVKIHVGGGAVQAYAHTGDVVALIGGGDSGGKLHIGGGHHAGVAPAVVYVGAIAQQHLGLDACCAAEQQQEGCKKFSHSGVGLKRTLRDWEKLL